MLARRKLSRRRNFISGAAFFVALILGHAAAFAACEKQAAKSAISWATDIEPLLHNCRSCHEFEPPQGLMISPGISYNFLVGVPSVESSLMRIEPGDPERSYIVHKLKGTHLEIGGEGVQMPIGFDLWPAQEVQLLIDWIKDCSPDN